jgi:hypothetical protein
MAQVPVYYFRKYDIATDQHAVSQRMATLDAIWREAGMPIMESRKDVESSEVDAEGFYPPVAR